MPDPISELYDIAETLQGLADLREPLQGEEYVLKLLRGRLVRAARGLEQKEEQEERSARYADCPSC